MKIKELSSDNPEGRPHIYVSELAKALTVTTNELKIFIDALYSTAFIDYYKRLQRCDSPDRNGEKC